MLLRGIVIVFLLMMQHAGAEDVSDAISLYKLGKWDEALKVVDIVLKNSSQDAAVLELKGKILLAEGKTKDAADVLFSALDAEKDRLSVLYDLGDVAFAERAWPDAIGFYTRFVNETKDDLRDGLLKLIYCHIAMKDFSEATRLVSGMDPLDKTHPGYFFAKAALERALGKGKNADDLLQKAQAYHGFEVYQKYLKDYVWLFKVAHAIN
jgi:tetratricopeptide (TPR) repeat protein